jgi:3-oxoacyl-[acyl-carrier protein] reductase
MVGKVALVTGASRGIGRVIAVRLARDGAAVALNSRSRPDEAADAARAVEQAGGRAQLAQCDMSVLADIGRVFDQAIDTFGRLDIVVANAGLPFIGVPVVDVTEADFDRISAVNWKGSFFTPQEAARRVADGGRIVDISSSTTVFTAAGMGLHAAGKAGSKIIVETLAAELGPRGITVNTVMPGATDTEFLKDAPQSERDRIASSTPLGRIGTPQDIAEVVAFVCSDAGGWISAQHLLANGGAKV